MADSKSEIFEKKEQGLTIILDKEGLKIFLPHRRKALKIDGIVFCPSLNDHITGIKNVRKNDPDLDGHFDEKPVYPGVSIAECANLTAAMLILLSNESLVGYPTVVDFHCECKRPVFPGDTIEINLNLTNKESRRGQDFYNFKYTVNKKLGGISKLVAEGTLTGTAT